jgi:hypothetical protein
MSVNTPDQPTLKLFIYGSCVSRDTAAAFPLGRVEITRYVARQSLISAFGGAPAAQSQASLLDSAFQRRMLEWDERSELPSLLRRDAGWVDLLLWDIVDERLGYFVFPDGSIVTNSVERITLNGAPFSMDGARHVPFGSEEHLEHFTIGLDAFQELLTELALLDRLLIIAPPWAETDDKGARTPSSFGLNASRGNDLSDAYLAAIRTQTGREPLGRELEVQAASDHKWGSAPFHYHLDVYRQLNTKILDAASTLPSRVES